LKFYYMKREII